MLRSAAFDIIGVVCDELEAARFALQTTLRFIHERQVFQQALALGITESLLTRCAENLELTFTLRLFSAFEAILRDFWRNGIGRPTEPDMRPLMDSIAARRGINANELAAAHKIRDYRNNIVHENLGDIRFDLTECSKSLGRYLARLPIQW